MWETIATVVIVLAALCLVLRKAVRVANGRDTGCSCGKGKGCCARKADGGGVCQSAHGEK